MELVVKKRITPVAVNLKYMQYLLRLKYRRSDHQGGPGSCLDKKLSMPVQLAIGLILPKVGGMFIKKMIYITCSFDTFVVAEPAVSSRVGDFY